MIGELIDGKYRLDRILGEGAMGVVYGGVHIELSRPIALKTLRPELGGRRDLLDRFEQEARAASAIGHPNIVQVFDLGRLPGGGRYMVMEHLEGRDLGALLADTGPISMARAADLFNQLLPALGAAHERGIVHRDLKPENLVVTTIDGRDHLKVVDFGVSKVLEGAGPLATARDQTAFGALLGTPAYMAPEQVRGQRDLDHRCDIWACGIVLFELLVGKVPWSGDSFQQILAEILETAPPAARQVVPEISEAVDAVIRRALSRDRDQRFASALEMRTALRDAVAGAGHGQEAQQSATPSSEEAAFVAALDHADLSNAVTLDGERIEKRAPVSASAGSFSPAWEDQPLAVDTEKRRFAAGFDGQTVELVADEETPQKGRSLAGVLAVAGLLLAVLGALAYLALQ